MLPPSFLPTADFTTQFGPAGFAFDYAVDAAERGILLQDGAACRGAQGEDRGTG